MRIVIFQNILTLLTVTAAVKTANIILLVLAVWFVIISTLITFAAREERKYQGRFIP